MERTNLARYIFVRGFLKFGFLAAALYVIVIFVWPGRSFAPHDLKIALAFPIAGLAWGFIMYFVDKRRSK